MDLNQIQFIDKSDFEERRILIYPKRKIKKGGEMNTQNEMLTSLGAARILDCSSERVRQLRKEGKLDAIPIGNSRMRVYRREDVERLARERKRERNQIGSLKASGRARG
jgi:hypothetical protein